MSACCTALACRSLLGSDPVGLAIIPSQKLTQIQITADPILWPYSGFRVPEPRPIHRIPSTYMGSSIGFAYARGRFTNISGVRLENVLALAEWYTRDDTFIVADDALIDLDPLLPGQSSPFETISRYNPAMQSCRVVLKDLFGPELPTERPRR